MTRLTYAFAFAAVSALTALYAAPSQAAAPTKVWVANTGVDNASCGAVTAPCATFQQAHDNVAAGGEVGVLNAGDYGTLNISPVSEPVPTVTTKERFALVMPVVNGRALDIRLRMLKPHELARAMSFGDDYKFAGNQGDQVRQIGNAWPCRLGQALIETLLADYAEKTNTKRREEVA